MSSCHTTPLFEEIVRQVQNPSSYLGTEPNSVHKDHASLRASIALCFPDRYTIGMSHLGLKILYSIVNRRDDFVAERLFAPNDDFAHLLRERGAPLFSLESKTPLRQFDILGFTIPYELSYTTMLHILDLAQIPLRAADRSDDDPLVIGGGAGVYNPEPLVDFFDFFVMGDGEVVIEELMEKAATLRGASRAEKLETFATVAGVYVPSFFDVTYTADGAIATIQPLRAGYEKVERLFLPTLAESPHPVAMVVPFADTVQERVNVEIDRGCTQGCRFCQAGTTYRPARERTPAEVLTLMEQSLDATGYSEVATTSLSAGDYSHIGELLTVLMDRYAGERISISLPSLRSKTVTEEIVRQIGRVKKTGITITAEAGSQRLRNVLNKKATEEEILTAARRLVAGGWRSVKLYFMIGLPTETREDVVAIYELASRIAAVRENNNRFSNVTVSVGNFVPKSHTAFQWFGQDNRETLQEKRNLLFGLVKKNRRLKLKFHDSKMSHLEAVFSRGDRRLGAVIEAAWRNGCRFDAWTEDFRFIHWMEAFEECGVDPVFYANRHFAETEVLPWSLIDSGLSKKYFWREWEMALQGELTDDCKTDSCLGCGLDPKGCFEPYSVTPPPVEKPSPEPPSQERYRYELTYQKWGNGRFISHLETKRLFERAFRMAKIPLAFTAGFSPHPKISYGPALGVGIESAQEFLELSLMTPEVSPVLIDRINQKLPHDIVVVDCVERKKGETSFLSRIIGFRYELLFDDEVDSESLEKSLILFLEKESYLYERTGKKKKIIDLRPLILSLTLEKSGSLMALETGSPTGATVKPMELLAALFAPASVPPCRIIKRHHLFAN